MIYWIKTNWIIKRIFSRYIWDIPNNANKVYLTFDDGPTPDITEWTLIQLNQYNAKATFFCIGDNVQKHPEIFKKILENGHAFGNHTFDHLNGWKTNTSDFIRNIAQCDNVAAPIAPNHAMLFRPPYGKIKKSQASKLLELGYRIVMWDVLSADFDTAISAEKCLTNVLKNIKSGSIIVFHDSIKASKNLQYALPKTLAFLKEKGYECDVIS